FARLHRHVRSVIEEIAPNDSAERFAALGVKVLRAQARFENRRTVVAGAWRIRARRFIIATGSSPTIPPVPGLAESPWLAPEDLFALESRPEHLVILGAGPAGIELAQAMARLGSRVTVLEPGQPLSGFDPELARIALLQLRDEGVDIRTGAAAARVERNGPDGVLLHLAGSGETLAASHL